MGSCGNAECDILNIKLTLYQCLAYPLRQGFAENSAGQN